jgi:hypothetical protein
VCMVRSATLIEHIVVHTASTSQPMIMSLNLEGYWLRW